MLQNSGFRDFLARVAEREQPGPEAPASSPARRHSAARAAEARQQNEKIAFVFEQGRRWVAFYHKVPFYDFLPPRLSDLEIESFGRNLAAFHKASLRAAGHLNPTWKSVGSDIAALYDALGSSDWRRERGIADAQQRVLQRHCDAFLENTERLGYYEWPKLPILIDWNPGNFSVGYDSTGFRFFSRWDYDWFRIEPRLFDFYFASRVVRDSGDQTVFSYTTGPLTEPRFITFLRAYHAVYPLSAPEILFLKEAYRFFVLNYVVHVGEHFFRPSIWTRLMQEALDEYLPSLDRLDLREVADRVLDPPLPIA
jgi:Ser/Thr protein kinase RdoA (MazF antagonist)